VRTQPATCSDWKKPGSEKSGFIETGWKVSDPDRTSTQTDRSNAATWDSSTHARLALWVTADWSFFTRRSVDDIHTSFCYESARAPGAPLFAHLDDYSLASSDLYDIRGGFLGL
jgi:hypothetical protein